MPSTRIKGQDTSVQITVDGSIQTALTAIRSLSIEPQFDLSSEGYLGEGTNRRDEVFNGVSGSLELHLETAEAVRFIRTILDRAQRRTPGTQVNIRTSLRYPNGNRQKVVLTDVYFSNMPLSFGSRTDYVTLSLSFECSGIQLI